MRSGPMRPACRCGPCPRLARGHVVPDDRDRRRPSRLLCRHHPDRDHPRPASTARTAGQCRRVPGPPRPRLARSRPRRRPLPPRRRDRRPPRQLYQAFDLQLLYNKDMHQVTIWATITPATPAPSPLSPTTTATATSPRLRIQHSTQEAHRTSVIMNRPGRGPGTCQACGVKEVEQWPFRLPDRTVTLTFTRRPGVAPLM